MVVIEENTIEIMKREFDHTIELADNAMLKHRPDLFDEWDFEKNYALGLDVYKVTRGSKKIVFWNCLKCKSSYDSPPEKRSIGRGCPYCAKVRVNDTNSLSSIYPDLAIQWHPTKNGDLIPCKVLANSSKKYWWICPEGHEWETSCKIRARNNNYECSICTNKKLLVGYNDMWTTNPKLASHLLNPEDGYKYMQFSSARVDWKCEACDVIIEDKIISDMCGRNKLSCRLCSEGTRYPEKVMYSLLKSLNFSFEWDRTREWSNLKRYDFYLKDFNLIIEVHGEQHYAEGFESLGGLTLAEVVQNDAEKQALAIKNGIDKYLVINARVSDFNYIKQSIESSDFKNIVNISKIDWTDVSKLVENSLTEEIWELWNNGNQDVDGIAEIMNMGRIPVLRALKQGRDIGKCSYTVESSLRNGYSKNQKSVVQLDMNGTLIKQWKSVLEPSKKYNTVSGISRCCRGGSKTAYGFKWMYAEDYYREVDIKND